LLLSFTSDVTKTIDSKCDKNNLIVHGEMEVGKNIVTITNTFV